MKKILFVGVLSALSISSAFADCALEDHLKVFRDNFGIYANVTEFKGEIIPDFVSGTSTLYLTFSGPAMDSNAVENLLGWVKLDSSTCLSLDHGVMTIKKIAVFDRQ